MERTLLDEAQLDELKKHDGTTGNCQCHTHWEIASHTMEKLWGVVRATRRWVKAPAGRESSEKEAELVLLLDELQAELREGLSLPDTSAGNDHMGDLGA